MLNIVSRSRKYSQGESSGGVTPSKPKPTGRERLLHLDAELEKANQAAAEIEEKVTRLEGVIAEAARHHEALQLAIMLDGGRALAELAAGTASDDSDIGRLAALADSSARAKAAAVAALPKARADLQDVQRQAVELHAARVAEVDRVVTNLADNEVRLYEATFAKLCRQHDKLVGFCRVFENNVGDILRTTDPLKIPRFDLRNQGSTDSDPYHRHNSPSDLTVGESARHYKGIREKLLADSNADIDPR
jgi:hypothetical protein